MVIKRVEWTRRTMQPEEVRPKGPEPPKKLVDAAMADLPAALREIRSRFLGNGIFELLQQLGRMGHIEDAGRWALYCHARDRRVTIEERSRPHKQAVFDSEGERVEGEFNEWVQKVQVVRATPGLWDWWRRALEDQSEKPVEEPLAGPRFAVELRGTHEQPIVFGEPQPKLGHARYAVVKALLAAGKQGLSKSELERKSGKNDAVKYLRNVRKLSSAWEKAIMMAGKSWNGYHIASQ